MLNIEFDYAMYIGQQGNPSEPIGQQGNHRASHLVYRATGQNPSAQWIQITNQQVLRSSRKQHKGVTCTNMLAFSQMRLQDAGTNLGRCDDRYRCRSLQWCVCECKIPQKYALLNLHLDGPMHLLSLTVSFEFPLVCCCCCCCCSCCFWSEFAYNSYELASMARKWTKYRDLS